MAAVECVLSTCLMASSTQPIQCCTGGQPRIARNFFSHRDADGPFSLLRSRLGWFDALFSLIFFSILTLVALQVERPWVLRFCSQPTTSYKGCIPLLALYHPTVLVLSV